MMTKELSPTKTAVRNYPESEGYGRDRKIKATYGFHYLRGNRRPYFSITGEIYKPGKRDCDACGCIHDHIRKHFPELAHLIRWHLVGDDASPMHYVENALYWLEQHYGISRWERRPNPDPWGAFKSTIAAGPDEDLSAFRNLEIPGAAPADLGESGLASSECIPGTSAAKAWRRSWLKAAATPLLLARTDSLREQMRADMEAAGVPYIDETAWKASKR